MYTFNNKNNNAFNRMLNKNNNNNDFVSGRVFTNKLYNAPMSQDISAFKMDLAVSEEQISKITNPVPPPPEVPPVVASTSSEVYVDPLAANNVEPIKSWDQLERTSLTPTTPDETLTSASVISQAITQILSSTEGFSGSDLHRKTMYATTISSSLLSLATHAVSLAQNNLTTGTKAMIGFSVTSDLISLANTLWYMSSDYVKPKSDINTVIGAVPSIVQDFTNESISQISGYTGVGSLLGNKSDGNSSGYTGIASLFGATNIPSNKVTANATNWMDYITPGIKCVVTLSLMIATGFDKDKVDYAVKLGSLNDLVNKTSKTADDAIGCVLTKMCGIDLTGDMATYTEVMALTQRSQELAILPAYKFLQDPTLCDELNKIFGKAIKLSIPKSKEVSNSLRIAIAGMNNNLQCLRDKLKVVNEILDVKRRQECVGLLLAGDKGTGKSTLAMYIFNKVADILGYPKDTYNIDKEGGFYTPYNGAVFGILNEFMGFRQYDDMLQSYNKIVSGDPYNFESACIESKTQPCQIKLLVSTSNDICPDMTKILSPGAIDALWSRTIRVKVRDLVQEDTIKRGGDIGRHTIQNHRKSDFSHLTLTYTTSSERNNANIESHLKTISVPALINLMAAQLAARELNFMQMIGNSCPNVLEGADRRIKFLKETIDGRVKANSDTNYFVVRLQGKLATGKTTLATVIANSFTNVYPNLKIHKVNDFKPFEELTGHHLFIVDDMIKPDVPEYSYSSYVSWINSLPQHSIVLLSQNTTFPRIRQYNLLGPLSNKPLYEYIYNVSDVSTISGVARRLGLNGLVKCDDGLYFNGDSQITIDAKGNYQFTINGQDVIYGDIPNIIFRYYKAHKNNTTDIVVMRTEAPYAANFDIDIESKDIKQLMLTLSSLKNILRSLSGAKDLARLKIDDGFLSYMNGKSPEKTWVVKEEVKTLQQLVDLGTRIYSAVFAFKPDCKVRITLQDEDICFIAMDRIIYMQGNAPEQPINFEWTNEGLYISSNNYHYLVKSNDYAEYVVNKNITGSMDNLPIHLIPELNKYFNSPNSQNPFKIPFINDITQLRININLLKSPKYTAWMLYKKHPLMCLVGGILVGSTILVSLVAFIKWMFKSSNKVSANTSDDENDLAEQRGGYIRSKGKNSRNQDNLLGDLRGKGYNKNENWRTPKGDSLDNWRDNLRSNTAVNKQLANTMKANNWTPPQLVKYVVSVNSYEEVKEIMLQWPDLYLDEVTKITSCMLTRKETMWQNPSQLEIFKDVLKKSYVQVITSGGVNYGLGLFDKYILTISHAFSDDKLDCEISSGGILYKAKCIKLMRTRDLAIIKVLDKTFPALPDIRSKLVDYDKVDQHPSSIFIRPIEGGTYYQLPTDYHKKVLEPYQDDDNPNYQLSEQIWITRFASGKDLNNFIKKGDCGFPLVTLVRNEYKIIGIHNAFSMNGSAYFSSINKQDIEFAFLESNSFNETMMPFEHLAHTDHKMPRYYWDALGIVKQSCYEGVSKLCVAGFVPQLNIYSNPKSKKIKIDIPGAKTVCETMPSAIQFDDKIMKPDKLIKNTFGNIVPVFAQAAKFADRLPEYGLIDKEVEKHVVGVIKTRVHRDYGTFKQLNTVKVLNGEPGTAMHNFDLSTSGGLYLKAKYRLTNKKTIIDNVGTKEKPFYQFATNAAAQEVRMLYEEHIACIKNGVAPIMVARDCPKVELLSIEKVKEGKVRLFNELDFFYNMMLKAFFGEALEAVISNHVHCPYKIGMNPYIEATSNMIKFNLFDGESLCTDVSGLDKSFPKEIIAHFVDTFANYLTKEQRKALSTSLINTLHVLDGSIYFLSTGNESGSFITTLLNCYCMEFLLYTYFTKMYLKKHNRYPSLGDIEANLACAFYGDDQMVKFAKGWIVSLQNYQKDAAGYNVKITGAKLESEKYMSFCSREYIPDSKSLLYFPALKKSSVVSSMYWYERIDTETMAQNLNIVLFEAAFHDKAFFKQVLHDVHIVAKNYNIRGYLDFCSYELYRDVFERYVKGELLSPSFLGLGAHAEYNDILKLLPQSEIKSELNKSDLNKSELNKSDLNKSDKKQSDLTKLIQSENKLLLQANTGQKMAVSKLNEYLMKIKSSDKLIWDDHSSGDPHMLVWNSILRFGELQGSGTGDTKKQARENAAIQVLDSLDSKSCTKHVTANSYSSTDDEEEVRIVCNKIKKMTMEEEFIQYSLQTQINIALKVNDEIGKVYLWFTDEVYPLHVEYKMVDVIRVERREVQVGNMHMNLYSILNVGAQKTMDKDIYFRHISKICPQADQDHYGVYIERELHSNMNSVAAEPAIMNQASSAQQAQDLPSNTNPQPTSVAPSMTTTGEDIMGAVQPLPTDVLQPVGAPPMLGVGAIDFDLKALAYEQFLDADVEFTVADDQPSGTILFQIPYDPLGEYINPYIKQWVSMHQRYTGALMFRFTVIGNPMFSGAIGVCWQPAKVTTPTIKISEAMKYAYHAEGVTLPWNRIHLLHDARRRFFYRTTDDTDIDDRPHLVMFLLMSIQNPLKPDAITRIRVSSKLANMSDPNSFRVSNPVIGEPPAISALGPYRGNFFNTFKQCFYKKLYMYTDGNLAGQQLSNTIYEYYPVNLNNPNLMAANTMLTAEADLEDLGQCWAFNQTNATPYVWESFPADVMVCVRWTIFGASQYFTRYNDKFKSIQDTINGGETEVKNVFEFLIPTGRIKFDDPANMLQAMWAYRAPKNDPPNTYKNYGGYKMVFSQGIIIVDVFQPTTNQSITTDDGTNPTINYGYIDNPRLFLDPSVEPIPANCSVLRLTFTQPSSVPTGIQGPTARDDEAMLRYFASIASRIHPSEVIQMQLTDATTQRNIATIRYNTLVNGFYIYGENGSYKTLPRSFDDINITSLEVVPLSNPMTLTDTSTWNSRIISSTAARLNPVFEEELVRKTKSIDLRPKGRNVKSNMAMIAALGSALGNPGNSLMGNIFSTGNNIYSTENQKTQNREQREHEKELQGNAFNQQTQQNKLEREFYDKLQGQRFEQETNLQSNRFGQEKELQGSLFEQQRNLQGGEFGQQSKLQKGQFKQESSMQQQQQKFEREQQQGQFEFTAGQNEAERANKRQMQSADFENQKAIAQQDVRNKAYVSGSTTALRNLPGSVFA